MEGLPTETSGKHQRGRGGREGEREREGGRGEPVLFFLAPCEEEAELSEGRSVVRVSLSRRRRRRRRRRRKKRRKKRIGRKGKGIKRGAVRFFFMGLSLPPSLPPSLLPSLQTLAARRKHAFASSSRPLSFPPSRPPPPPLPPPSSSRLMPWRYARPGLTAAAVERREAALQVMWKEETTGGKGYEGKAKESWKEQEAKRREGGKEGGREGLLFGVPSGLEQGKGVESLSFRREGRRGGGGRRGRVDERGEEG